MDTSNVIQFIRDLENEILSVQNLFEAVNTRFIDVDDRIYNIENYLYQQFTLADTRPESRLLTFSRYAELDNSFSDTISIEDIKPAFDKPIIIYNGGETVQQIVCENIPIVIPSLYNYFLSSTGDDMVFILKNSYNELTINLRQNLRTQEPLISGVMEDLIIGSNLTINPDFRGERYNIEIIAVDKEQLNNFLANPDSAKLPSDVFTFDIIERPLPTILKAPEIEHVFPINSTTPLIEYAVDKLQINSDTISIENNTIQLEYSLHVSNPSFADVSLSELDTAITITPDYRGCNNIYKDYDITIVASNLIYNIVDTYTIHISEPPPISITKQPDDITGILNDTITINMYEYFVSNRSTSLSFTSNVPYIQPNRYFTDTPFLEIENSNIIIQGDYRNCNILFDILATDTSYPDRKTILQFSVDEIAPPLPNTIDYSDTVCNLNVTCNLYNYFESSTQNCNLLFSFVTRSAYDNVFSIDGSNLNIVTNLREYDFHNEAHIKATDTIYDVSSKDTDYLSFSVHERASVDIIKSGFTITSNTQINFNDFYSSPNDNQLSFNILTDLDTNITYKTFEFNLVDVRNNQLLFDHPFIDRNGVDVAKNPTINLYVGDKLSFPFNISIKDTVSNIISVTSNIVATENRIYYVTDSNYHADILVSARPTETVFTPAVEPSSFTYDINTIRNPEFPIFDRYGPTAFHSFTELDIHLYSGDTIVFSNIFYDTFSISIKDSNLDIISQSDSEVFNMGCIKYWLVLLLIII